MSTTNQLTMDIPPSWTWNPSVDQYNYYHNYYYHGISEREHLFEKPLTPSDVGKLNRLVIPKQHAERHFPLDAESGEKGLLLSFEDECGKAWRFRYSYWTSSQSYVLTKGWSRFIKEKRLDAGDVVFFERRRANADHLYIRWRRRGDAPGSTAAPLLSHWSPVLYGAPIPSSSSPNQGSSEEHGAVVTTNSKTLRLFGVNLEFPSRELHQLPVHPQVEHQFLL